MSSRVIHDFGIQMDHPIQAKREDHSNKKEVILRKSIKYKLNSI